jgi:hypothetical protein
MNNEFRVATEDDLLWLEAEPDPEELARSLQASAIAALRATRLPDGYESGPVDRDTHD